MANQDLRNDETELSTLHQTSAQHYNYTLTIETTTMFLSTITWRWHWHAKAAEVVSLRTQRQVTQKEFPTSATPETFIFMTVGGWLRTTLLLLLLLLNRKPWRRAVNLPIIKHHVITISHNVHRLILCLATPSSILCCCVHRSKCSDWV